MKKWKKNLPSTMTPRRMQLLTQIQFREASPKDVWETRFQQLVAFRETHGHCNAPTKWKQDKALGRWISTQRKQYKLYQAGKRSLLTPEKIARLESIGFEWDRSGANQRTDKAIEEDGEPGGGVDNGDDEDEGNDDDVEPAEAM